MAVSIQIFRICDIPLLNWDAFMNLFFVPALRSSATDGNAYIGIVGKKKLRIEQRYICECIQMWTCVYTRIDKCKAANAWLSRLSLHF